MTHTEGRHRLTEPAARPKHVLALLGALGVLIAGALAYAPGAQADGATSPTSVAGDALSVPAEAPPLDTPPVDTPPVEPPTAEPPTASEPGTDPAGAPSTDAPESPATPETPEAPGGAADNPVADGEASVGDAPADDSVTAKAADKSTISLGAGSLPVTALDAPQRSCGVVRAVVGKDGWLFALPAGDAKFTAVRLTLTNGAGDTVTAQTGVGSVLPGGRRAFVRSSPRGLALASAEADVQGTATSFALVGACPAPKPAAPPAPPVAPPVPAPPGSGPDPDPVPTSQPDAPAPPDASVSPVPSASPTPSATQDSVKNVVATQPATPSSTTSSASDVPDSGGALDEPKVAQAAKHAKSLNWNLAAYAAALLLLVVFALIAWFVVLRSRTSE